MDTPNTPRTPPRPEVLAPAGGWDALRAAANNGADAVYFGLTRFNARHRAANFAVEELPEVLDYLHRRGVKGFVTLNTLIFADELAEARELVIAVALAGADAVIVQDLGLARLIRRVAPTLPIHASTQMTLTEPRGIRWARDRLGIERAVLARELSAEEIRRVTATTDVPVEVFIHGALCVAYSGQCLTSEALGGRSANRGQCAQACRLPYEMIVDGRPRDLGDRAYLLSPQDLAGYEWVRPLVEAGVVSFKIEGRLKSPHYVAATVKTYRDAVDAAVADREYRLGEGDRLDLEQTFSRGFTPGFLAGIDHQKLVRGRSPKARGVRVGDVAGVSRRGVIVANRSSNIDSLIKPGDGVVFDEGRPQEQEQGGRVWKVTPHGDRVELTFEPGSIDLERIAPGQIVWKTDDPALRKRLEQTFAQGRGGRKTRLSAVLRGELGGPLRLTLTDPLGREASAAWDGPLEEARKHPLDPATVRDQLGRLGDTPFELADVTLELPASAMVPKSVFNDLRRRAAADLGDARAVRHPIAEPDALERARRRYAPTADPVRWYVLARTPGQLRAVLDWRPPVGLARPSLVWCDFEDTRRYRDAVGPARDAGLPIGLATLRILKPGEEGLLNPIVNAGPDAVLVRNLGSLDYLRERAPDLALVGDFSLNVANDLTADLLLGEGFDRLVPSYDLNWDQFTALTRLADPARFEAVIHQHMPMFHMEHCAFAAFLSGGKDHRDCGRPCETHRVELRDRVGSEFPLVPDAGCRNTVYNAIAQSAAEYVGRMRDLGVRHFRVELLREPAEQVGPLLERYARVIAGSDDGRDTWRQLRALNQLGVTRGTLRLA